MSQHTAVHSTTVALQKIVEMVRTKYAACSVWLVAGLVAFVAASPLDDSTPFGRVCIGVLTGEKEQPLDAQSKPSANTFIVAHAEANESCELLIFALSSGDGRLACDWRPQFVALRPSEEIQVPETPVVWRWSEASAPVNLYVLFLHPNSKDSRKLKALVSAMLNPNVTRELLDRQGVKLRELATRSGTRQGEVIHVTETARAQVAATYRGANFPWRAYASSVNFSEAKPGLLVFVLGNLRPAGRESGFPTPIPRPSP